MGKRQYLFAILVILALFVFSFFRLGLNLYVDWLWFKAVKYSHVFIKALVSNLAVRIAVAVWLFLFFFINLLFTRKEVLKHGQIASAANVFPLKDILLSRLLTPKRVMAAYIILSVFLAFIFSSIGAGQWLTVQKFLHSQPFGISDPLFGKDIGFYVFQLPFFEFVYSLLMLSAVISIIFVGLIYFFTDPNQFKQAAGFTRGKFHLSLLAAFLLILQAGKYWLAMYNLLQSPRGVAYGASYTDVHAQLPALKILMIIALVTSLLVLVNVFLKKMRWVVISILLLMVSSIVLGSVFPGAVQKFIVEPDEFRKEQPYLEHNINYTRKAFALDKIETQFFDLKNQLTREDLEVNQETVSNIRLWDWRPLLQTYSEMQELRPYYNFANVDIDRYEVDGRLRQVMLAARELDQNQLDVQAQTWINQKLRYTHGYGVVMTAVSTVTEEGLPEFYLKDIPPRATVKDLKVTRPEIYYGEQTDEYVLVKTKSPEFDYPAATGENIETTYEADSGILVGSLLKRLIFAAYFKDYKILLAGEITPESRLLMRRNIRERIETIMPYLEYDRDPYLVLADGHLYWLQDAYTISDSFPYSEPIGGINYIRNSVKVVVNAYTGAVDFYVAEPNDPIIKSYMEIFPGTFKPLSKMPEAIKKHVRYPVDLFLMQAKQYQAYHMTNPRDFYNKEDLWTFPKEIIGGESKIMDPYYVVMRLPGEEKTDYFLMIPYTPAKKQKMASWLAVRNSPETYGQMINFIFPRNQLVFGPMQIEARIDQDSEISSQLSLWDQRGSQVIRGNLIVLPVENSLLYVEPIFLQGEQSRLPELRRVIVAYKDQVVMEKTLEDALRQLFGKPADTKLEPGEKLPPEIPDTEEPVQPEDLTISDLVKRANAAYDRAQQALRRGDWAGYGEAIGELEKILLRLQQLSNQQL